MDLTSLYKNATARNLLHSRYFVEGVILGAASCPEIPMPNVWLPWVFKQEFNANNQQEHADKLYTFFKYCLQQMRDDTLSAPNYVRYKDVTATSYQLEDNEPISNWCKGILTAHAATESSWQTAWNKMHQSNPRQAPLLAKDLKHCLTMFDTFANPQQKIQRSRAPDELAKKLPSIAKSLNATLISYVRISGELAKYLPNQFEIFAQQQ